MAHAASQYLLSMMTVLSTQVPSASADGSFTLRPNAKNRKGARSDSLGRGAPWDGGCGHRTHFAKALA